MHFGIPAYQLPRADLIREIARIEAMGVHIVLNHKVERTPVTPPADNSCQRAPSRITCESPVSVRPARRRALKRPFGIGDQPERPLTAARSISCRIAYGNILLVDRSWYGDICAGDFDGHATASTLDSRHVPVSKSSRAAASGVSACLGH